VLGTMMALGMSSFLFCFVNDRKYRLAMGCGLCFCFIILQMSTTVGALAVLLVLLCLLPFCRALRWKFSLAIPFFSLITLLAGGIIVLIVGNAEHTLGLFGRDISLTGRTTYWPLMLNKIWERPWLGYGYETFWLGGWKGEPASIWRQLADGNEPPHAHNGFLNLWFDIGLVGLITFFIGYAVNCFRAIVWIRTIKTVEGLVPILYLPMLMLFNLTESFLMRADIFWVFYVSMTLSMHRRYEILLPHIDMQSTQSENSCLD
jgi:exopolysaccharide production protein ExoQ